MLPNGGSGSQETSECQFSPFAPLGISVSVDWQDLRMSLRSGGVRVNVQVTEMASECLLLLQADLLVAEEQDLMLRQSGVQVFDLLVAERRGQVDVGNLGAQIRGQALHLDSGITHGIIPCGRRGCVARCSPGSVHRPARQAPGTRYAGRSGRRPCANRNTLSGVPRRAAVP